MALFEKSASFDVINPNVQFIAEYVATHFKAEGYEVSVEETGLGALVSMTKGGLFKMVLGMKTALNLKLSCYSDRVFAQASIGIFGIQAIPTLVMLFVTWPVLLTQIWGMIRQAKLDDEVIDVVGEAIRLGNLAAGEQKVFCTACGAHIAADSETCPVCGAAEN